MGGRQPEACALHGGGPAAQQGAASVPGAGFRIAVPGMHGRGRHGGPGLPVQPEATVELVANRERIVHGEGNQCRRDMAGHAFDDDADLLDLVLDVVGGAQNR